MIPEETNPNLFTSIVEYSAMFFIFVIGIVSLLIVIVFVFDISQSRHAIRKNYPVVGHFRYFFEKLGEFFRQYFFAMDREEMPFNRATRSWVYRAAKNLDNTSAFGSTRDITPENTIIFVNCPFPTLQEDAQSLKQIEIGPYCKHSYKTKNIFHISGMSYGALSKPAVQALSRGAKMAGCWLNTGEGGLSAHHIQGGGDIVFQIGTAKYGVRDTKGKLNSELLKNVADNPQVKMFEIKLSQGAKPGKGGILPGIKVTEEIASIRCIPAGESSISPNRHEDINSVSELLDYIQTVREITQKPVGFKIVIGAYGWLDNLFLEIQRRGIESAPDFITIDSADGGSGAAPASLMDYMGLPISESLPMLTKMLEKYKFKKRIKVIASGKLITPAQVAWALCVGADFVVSARGFMFSLGCIQAMQCNKNTCPTGITTHNKRLQKGLDVELKSQRVNHYARNMENELSIIAHSCGVNEPRELRPFHARIVSENGQSVGLDQLYDLPEN